jgi:hypothetical protein
MAGGHTAFAIERLGYNYDEEHRHRVFHKPIMFV